MQDYLFVVNIFAGRIDYWERRLERGFATGAATPVWGSLEHGCAPNPRDYTGLCLSVKRQLGDFNASK